MRRLYGAEDLVEEQDKAFKDAKRAAEVKDQEKARKRREAEVESEKQAAVSRRWETFNKGEAAEKGAKREKKRSLWAKYRTQIVPSLADDEELSDGEEEVRASPVPNPNPNPNPNPTPNPP